MIAGTILVLYTNVYINKCDKTLIMGQQNLKNGYLLGNGGNVDKYVSRCGGGSKINEHLKVL